ncbi:response regulator transcription factor [Streptomyces sp. NPDC021749]|uniref:response regulator transcription factor n=1 Tax=Streptomyces sp. NPDC021749 TaxID=3154905 RepID=UPI0033D5A7E8
MSALSVAVHAGDQITRLALVSYIQQRPYMVLSPTGTACTADVVVAAVGHADDSTMDLLRRLSPSPGSRFLVIVDGKWYTDLHNALDLGVRAVLFRSDFTWTKFSEAVRAVGDGQGDLPAALQGRLMDQVRHTHREVLAPRGLTASGLTSREIDVLRLVAEGYDLHFIAEKLRYSERTVRNVLYGLMKRLNLRNRTHAVSYAIRSGLI